VSTKTGAAATFTGLVDLAAQELGGRALETNDEFFAGMANLIKPEPALFIEGKYTDRGKWMDGWESRRKRTPGYDYCVLALGAPGTVLGLDIDTRHFVGNHPPFASVEGVWAARNATPQELAALAWHELLPQSPLRPDAQNLFAARAAQPVTHVRLNIFPDGGVARFRVYGHVAADFSVRELDAQTTPRVEPSWVDLCALKSGGMTLACSDAFFGPMHNLLLPGRAENMGGGWETRRKRAPGHDWLLVRLGVRGRAKLIEVDTNHFKGNFPDRCSLECIDAREGDVRITELTTSTAWQPLLPPVKLQASTRHFFSELVYPGAATHLRLNIFPDGGISRLRVWGERDG
jgi:allantoicase